MMKIILNPTDNINELFQSYARAIKHAKELYIASAFLTDWSMTDRLNKECEKFLFLIGTDFGLTRKKACKNIIKWLPRKFKSDFLAVPTTQLGNFHPKVVAWKESDDDYYCIIGSSNLTNAAFKSNYEANVECQISEKDYQKIALWLEEIARNSQPINSDWLAHYKERSFKYKQGKDDDVIKRVINITLPKGAKYREAIQDRRKQQKAFADIVEDLKKSMEDCAKGKITNDHFWNTFWSLWGTHKSRFQGSGLQITGKNADWKQSCNSVMNIINKSQSVSEIHLDRIVRQEIDSLANAGNPVRGAWLTEILCHYFPDLYQSYPEMLPY